MPSLRDSIVYVIICFLFFFWFQCICFELLCWFEYTGAIFSWFFIGELIDTHREGYFTLGKLVIVLDNTLHICLEYLETFGILISIVTFFVFSLKKVNHIENHIKLNYFKKWFNRTLYTGQSSSTFELAERFCNGDAEKSKTK